MDEQAAIAAFVGKKASYYAERWQRTDADSPPGLSFNLAAALFGLLWLAYRKIYVPLFALIGVMIAEVAVAIYLEEAGLVPANVIVVWDRISTFVYAAVVAGFGNRWYWRRFQKTLAVSREVSPNPELQEDYLRERGGTSIVSVLALLGAVIGVIALAVFATTP